MTPTSTRLFKAFDEAAVDWGCQGQVGYGGSREIAENDYDIAKASLLLRIERLEKQNTKLRRKALKHA